MSDKPKFQPLRLFGKGPTPTGRCESPCHLCARFVPCAYLKKPGHPITEVVCERCWDKAQTWCFDCYNPDARCVCPRLKSGQ